MQQLVAAEALIAATQKKKDSNFIVSNGVEILKQLYRSKDDHIKVFANLNFFYAWIDILNCSLNSDNFTHE